MKLYIYDKNGKQIKEFKNIKSHGLKTMFLGSPARQVLMFKHEHGDGNIDLINGMTFALYNEKKGKVYE